MAGRAATSTVKPANQVERFYAAALEHLVRGDVPFLVGGTHALREYVGIYRKTKDLDIFCTAQDYPRLLSTLAAAGFRPEVTYPLWLAKAFRGENYVDLIFSSANGLCRVDDIWFRHARTATLFGFPVRLIPPEEMIWSKAYVQNRDRFDGADIAHIIHAQGPALDWRRLLARMDNHWEVLLAHLVNFRFAYPAERDAVPEWLMRKLCARLADQLARPAPHESACRGWLLSPFDYESDVAERRCAEGDGDS